MNKPLRVVRIIEGTSVDGPGLRTSVYFAGCRHHCHGCHNPSTWDFNAGEEMTVEQIMGRIEYNGFNVTFTGGDPLYSSEAILPLAVAVKEAGYTLWCYTGFVYEELLQNGTQAQKDLLEYIDVLVDGPFVKELLNTDLIFRGSENQRIIDLEASRSAGRTEEWKFPY